MYCICCKKDKLKPNSNSIHLNSGWSEEDYIWRIDKKENPVGKRTTNNRMWNDGIVNIIDAGYGSSHDTDSFVIAICDDCIKTNLEDGTLLYHSNYMSPNAPFVEEEVNKSKQIYRRRKNLDNLV